MMVELQGPLKDKYLKKPGRVESAQIVEEEKKEEIVEMKNTEEVQ